MSTVAALLFLLFTLSAETLTQSVDVAKLTWAKDVYMAAAAFTSAAGWRDAIPLSTGPLEPEPSLRSIRSPQSLSARGGRPTYFLC